MQAESAPNCELLLCRAKKDVRVELTLIFVAAMLTTSLCSAQESKIERYRSNLQTSRLKDRAISAGGKLQEVHAPNPARLLGDVDSMMQQSDVVVLAHIVRNVSQLAPSGDAPVLIYDATVLKVIKGTVSDNITFSVPVGLVFFDRNTSAAVAVQGFTPPVNGGRYVLFLRYSRGDERLTMPGMRLVGDGVQGAFQLDNEKVRPLYHHDALQQKYKGVAAAGFVKEAEASAARQKHLAQQN